MAKTKDFNLILDGTWYNNDSMFGNILSIEADFFRYCDDKEIEFCINLKNKNANVYIAQVEEFLQKSKYPYKRNDTYLSNTVHFVVYEYAEIRCSYDSLNLRFKDTL